MTREDVFKSIQERLKAIGLVEMQKRINEKFFDMDEVVEYLYRALVAGKNIILYGPGGFGKTEVVIEFLKKAELEHYTLMGYEDMDVEGLLGIPNMKQLLDNSVYEIAFDKTIFIKPGVLILEEFLDVNPKTAIALKDILTSGGYKQGDNFTESLISSVIICSNKSPYEVSVDNSTAAFYQERFPVVFNLTWTDFSYNRYVALITKIVGEEEYKAHEEVWNVLAELAHRTCVENDNVSPRIVKDAIHILQHNEHDVKALLIVDGINTSILDEVIDLCIMRDERERVIQTAANIASFIRDVLAEQTPSTRFIMDSIAKLDYIYNKLTDIHIVNEDSIILIAGVGDKCKQTSEALWKRVSSNEIVGDEELLDKLFEI